MKPFTSSAGYSPRKSEMKPSTSVQNTPRSLSSSILRAPRLIAPSNSFMPPKKPIFGKHTVLLIALRT